MDAALLTYTFIGIGRSDFQIAHPICTLVTSFHSRTGLAHSRRGGARRSSIEVVDNYCGRSSLGNILNPLSCNLFLNCDRSDYFVISSSLKTREISLCQVFVTRRVIFMIRRVRRLMTLRNKNRDKTNDNLLGCMKCLQRILMRFVFYYTRSLQYCSVYLLISLTTLEVVVDS